ncbi:hypothetical protein K461DRAFT_98593 [Myriangium duriaei CBS 260.36]|uniref:Uncharacterized protein n=1 Tax=Myriangium duriaei CBS 260.36 TaxID=1168546 RepID=A0A9P4MHC0_9PEZI|nr:hypothetical protein K461DRAFT_98593 [Myriangium duriaei CBS 260.36]
MQPDVLSAGGIQKLHEPRSLYSVCLPGGSSVRRPDSDDIPFDPLDPCDPSQGSAADCRWIHRCLSRNAGPRRLTKPHECASEHIVRDFHLAIVFEVCSIQRGYYAQPWSFTDIILHSAINPIPNKRLHPRMLSS